MKSCVVLQKPHTEVFTFPSPQVAEPREQSAGSVTVPILFVPVSEPELVCLSLLRSNSHSDNACRLPKKSCLPGHWVQLLPPSRRISLPKRQVPWVVHKQARLMSPEIRSITNGRRAKILQTRLVSFQLPCLSICSPCTCTVPSGRLYVIDQEEHTRCLLPPS